MFKSLSLFPMFALGFLVTANHLWAQAYSFSDASHGGTAMSTSTSYNNGKAVSRASSHGGIAIAEQVSDGRHGGYANGETVANTIYGQSHARGHSQAIGPFSVAQNRILASSHFGKATAKGHAQAGPFGHTEVHSTALSDFGNATSDVYGNASYGATGGYGMSHSFGPLTYTHTIGTAHGLGGYAESNSIGVSIGTRRPAYAEAQAHSRARFGGRANSRAAHIVDGN